MKLVFFSILIAVDSFKQLKVGLESNFNITLVYNDVRFHFLEFFRKWCTFTNFFWIDSFSRNNRQFSKLGKIREIAKINPLTPFTPRDPGCGVQ